MSDETLLGAFELPHEVDDTPLPGATPLGQGGMGRVYRVHDEQLGRDVALKVLRRELVEDPAARARFVAEARLTAQLDHPGVVPIHAMGTFADGQPWFRMKEVRGRTLEEVAPELDRRDHVEVLRRVCEALAAAHARGVVHRDIKPDNVMVGAFGEVLLLDWGIATRVGEGTTGPASGLSSHRLTQLGRLPGTPGYIAPELFDGAGPSPRSDVYALGCLLLAAAGPDPGLRELARECRSTQPSQRPADASVVASRISDWLEGADRRDRAVALLDEALARLPDAERLHDASVRLSSEAAELARTLGPQASLSNKRSLWALEDEADATRQQAVAVELEVEGRLQGALAQAPEEAAVHARLVGHHFRRLRRAEQRGERTAVVTETARVHRHLAYVPESDARVAAARRWLQGAGRLSLRTSPGCRVEVYGYEEVDRVWVPRAIDGLGGLQAPLVELELPHGPYLLKLHREEGGPALHYPVRIERLGHLQPPVLELPGVGWDGDDAVVLAGWFLAGGDADAPGGLPRMRLWIDTFAMRRQPVTNGQYLDFLNDLLDRGEAELAARYAPSMGVDREPLWGRTSPTGHYEMRPDEEGDAWPPDWHIAAVDFDCAQAFARWEAARTGLPWRLPTEWEVEKAARGADGRAFPWGERADRDFCCNRDSQGAYPFPAAPAAFPTDTSVYGVRHLAGNFHDWCASAWFPVCAVRSGDHVVPEPVADDHDMVVIRGGSWNGDPAFVRAASRQSLVRRNRSTLMSFRLVRSL